MGMLLSVPMIFVGLVLMVRAWRKPQASLELSPGKKA
jgi:phosphatidylglycerol:prolipoprotein diacylglycerol transferase